MSAQIRRLSSAEPDFMSTLDTLLAFEGSTDAAIEVAVAEILRAVRSQGDAAVVDFTRRFDHLDVADMSALELPKAELDAALAGLPAGQRAALEAAAARVRSYHERQVQESWCYNDESEGMLGTRLGQKVTPLDRVGLYVPGGRASYPSSVLMNAIPAKVAGVGELIMVVPTPRGERNPLVLAAAAITGVDRVFTIGGAQAVAALAYGTATIPQVDKIVGPGNAYVASAKLHVFGTVGIDMVAGPSEVLIISDGSGNPDWVAMDLFAQAEPNDTLAQATPILGSDASGALSTRRDEDYFVLTLPAAPGRRSPNTIPGEGLREAAILRIELTSPAVQSAIRVFVEPAASADSDGGAPSLRAVLEVSASKGREDLRIRNLPIPAGSGRVFVAVRGAGFARPPGESRYHVRLLLE